MDGGDHLSLPRRGLSLRPGRGAFAPDGSDAHSVPRMRLSAAELAEREDAVRRETRVAVAAELMRPVETLLGSLEKARSELAADRSRLRAEVAELATRLAGIMAEELVGRTLSLEQHNIRGIVDGVLAEAFPSGIPDRPVTLRGHPDDILRVTSHLRERGQAVNGVPDERLPRGDLRVESERLVFDASVAERLERMKDRLAAETGA